MVKYYIKQDEVAEDYHIALAMHHLPIPIAKKKIAHTKVARRYKATQYPNSNTIGITIFNFIRDNDNLTTEKSGMQGYSTGFNKPAIKQICKDYGLDFFQIKEFVSYYERKMLDRQNKMFDKQKEK
jgi:hypothetical protein